MTYFQDLTPCDYFGFSGNGVLLAVGWLGEGHEYARGSVGQEFFEKLLYLSKSTYEWQPFWIGSMGFHDCELCQFIPASFTGTIWIPYQGHIYLAPWGILHYIAQHWYKPPSIFIEAVISCPEEEAYTQAFLENGGQKLIEEMEKRPRKLAMGSIGSEDNEERNDFRFHGGEIEVI